MPSAKTHLDGSGEEGSGKVESLASFVSKKFLTERSTTMTTMVQRPPRNGVDVPRLFATLDTVKAAPHLAHGAARLSHVCFRSRRPFGCFARSASTVSRHPPT